MSKISFFVHTSVAKEITELLPEAAKPWIKTFDATEANTFKHPQFKWDSDLHYSVAILPGSWATSKWRIPPEVTLKCIQGTLRLVFWRADSCPNWSLPVTVIPKKLSKELSALAIGHVCRIPTWGLQSLMPIGSKIYTERVRSEQQMAQKIAQVIELVKESKAPYSPDLIQTNLQNLMKAVWSEKDLRLDSKSITFQVGLHPQHLACSMRWVGTRPDFNLWLKPEAKWQSLFANNLMSAVQMNDELKETEVILVLGQPQAGDEPFQAPSIVDVLTVARLRVAPDLADQAAQFEFEYFDNYKTTEEIGRSIGKV